MEESKKKNKNKYLFIILLVVAVLLFIGISYAFVQFNIFGTKTYTITGGELSLTLDESSNDLTIGQDNAIPITDYDGLKETGYNFSIQNGSNTAMTYNIYVDANEENTMDMNVIRFAYAKNSGEYVVGGLKDHTDLKITTGTIGKNETIKYNLKFWIGLDAVNEDVIGKVFSVKLRVEGVQLAQLAYQDESGANMPDLASNMIPVTYDEESGEWIKADIYDEWYNYDTQMWANAVTVTITNREKYLSAPAGEVISMDDINTMWVWVPRYEYETITSTTATEIKVNFLHETTSNATINYITHPAFTFGDEELTGIWVAKFEASSNTACTAGNYSVGTDCDFSTLGVLVRPNVTSWRGIRPSNMFTAVRNMELANNMYGFVADEVDTHMMKNMEWGMIAYLSQSKYGKYGNNNYSGANKEIYQNKSVNYITGNSNGTPSTSTTNVQVEYNVAISGTGASTTGTVYGVYDMNGGSMEDVMGVLQDNTGTNTPMSGNSTTLNSGYTGLLYSTGSYTSFVGISYPDTKYYDLYAFGTTESDNSRGLLGDATKETNGWYGDYTYFIMNGGPWFYRGGKYADNDAISGIFSFNRNTGASRSDISFRPVLVK